MRDVLTVLRKELRELSVVDGGLIMSISFLVFVGLIGVVLPWQLGMAWLEAPWVMVLWAWMPLFLVTTVTADSFAGERERHTLETLLATRLPDWAILVGKVVAGVLWVWAATLVCVPVGLITVNVSYVPSGIALYDAHTLLGICAVTFLAALLGATLGVLVSLRAGTVRQAQQTLMIIVMLILFTPILALRLLPPEVVAKVFGLFMGGSQASVSLAIGSVFLGVDAVLLFLALGRFQRRKLLLH